MVLVGVALSAACRHGEELQRKLCSTDGARPLVNLEEEEGLLRDAYALFHGSAGALTLNTMLPEKQRTQPAGPPGEPEGSYECCQAFKAGVAYRVKFGGFSFLQYKGRTRSSASGTSKGSAWN